MPNDSSRINKIRKGLGRGSTRRRSGMSPGRSQRGQRDCTPNGQYCGESEGYNCCSGYCHMDPNSMIWDGVCRERTQSHRPMYYRYGGRANKRNRRK